MSEQTVNQDLSDVHDTLVEQVNALSDQLGKTSDPDLAQAILTEMREFTHRVDLVQSLLFTAASDRIANKVAAVKKATDDLETAISKITSITAFVKGCTDFLTVVDKAIDLAKVL